MDTNNKENANPIDDMMNFSTDSLESKLIEGDDNQVDVVSDMRQQLEAQEEIARLLQTSAIAMDSPASLGPALTSDSSVESPRVLPAPMAANNHDSDQNQDDDDDDITPEVLLPTGNVRESELKAFGGDKLVSFANAPQVIDSADPQTPNSDDQPMREAAEYADDLVRDLINDTNLSIKESAAAAATEEPERRESREGSVAENDQKSAAIQETHETEQSERKSNSENDDDDDDRNEEKDEKILKGKLDAGKLIL